ncbi:hypothetical protein [Streptomyces sp. NPDC046805]|uniref:hypothetical protein n=1 Tax=Streptomyces sp. NPDC046805 TaxID=3155134 RepID=UPI0033F14EB3
MELVHSMFPGLRKLRLYIRSAHSERSSATLDLSRLAGIPDLAVTVNLPPYADRRVIGDELLPPGAVRLIRQPSVPHAPPPSTPWWRRIAGR